MAPPPAATAVATRRHAAAASHASPRRAGRGAEAPSTRRAPLRVVPTRSRRGIRGGRTAAGRGRLLPILSVSMVVAALLAVVVGQALLANGQVNLSNLQQELTLEQSAHSQAELAVAQLETPPRIVAAATQTGPRRAAQPNRAALRLTVRAPPHPEGDARTRTTPADNLPGGCGRAVGAEHGQHLFPFVHVRRDNHADVDAVSVATRQEPDRARAGSGRQSTSKTASARSQGGTGRSGDPSARGASSATRTTRPARPSEPGRRQPAGPRRPAGAGSTATRPRQRPHRPSGQGRSVSRCRANGADGKAAPSRGGCDSCAWCSSSPCCSSSPDWSMSRSCVPARTRRRPVVNPRSQCPSPRCVAGFTTATDPRWPSLFRTDDVVADDFQIAHPVQTALALSPLVHVPATTLAAELHRRTGYVVVARQLSQATGQTISADAFTGISLIADSKRVVPNGNLASPVVGSHERRRSRRRRYSNSVTIPFWPVSAARARIWSRPPASPCPSRP